MSQTRKVTNTVQCLVRHKTREPGILRAGTASVQLMQAAEFIPSCLLTLSSCPVPEEISRGHLIEEMVSLVGPSTEMLFHSRIVLDTTRNSVKFWVHHGPEKNVAQMLPSQPVGTTTAFRVSCCCGSGDTHMVI